MPVAHLLRLVCKTVLLQSAGRYAHQIEDVSVLTDQRIVGLLYCLCGLLLGDEAAELVRNVIRKPGAAEVSVRLEPSHGELSHVEFDVILEGKEQAGRTVMLKGGAVVEPCAVQQNAVLREHIIDAVNPFVEAPPQPEGSSLRSLPSGEAHLWIWFSRS